MRGAAGLDDDVLPVREPLAHLYLLRDQNAKPAWLVFVVFTGDDTIANGVATEAEWRSALQVVEHALGLGRSELRKYVLHVFLPAQPLELTVPVRDLVWNVEWARPSTNRGGEMRRQIVAERPDIIRVTEGFAKLLPSVGHVSTPSPTTATRSRRAAMPTSAVAGRTGKRASAQ